MEGPGEIQTVNSDELAELLTRSGCVVGRSVSTPSGNRGKGGSCSNPDRRLSEGSILLKRSPAGSLPGPPVNPIRIGEEHFTRHSTGFDDRGNQKVLSQQVNIIRVNVQFRMCKSQGPLNRPSRLGYIEPCRPQIGMQAEVRLCQNAVLLNQSFIKLFLCAKLPGRSLELVPTCIAGLKAVCSAQRTKHSLVGGAWRYPPVSEAKSGYPDTPQRGARHDRSGKATHRNVVFTVLVLANFPVLGEGCIDISRPHDTAIDLVPVGARPAEKEPSRLWNHGSVGLVIEWNTFDAW